MSDVRLTDINHHLNHLDFDPVLPLIPPNARLLDVGCGRGTWLTYLAIHRPDITVYGIDKNTDYVKECRDHGLNVTYMAAEELTSYNEYDVVTSFHVLEHIPNDRDVLRLIVKASRLRVILILPRWFIRNDQWLAAWKCHYQLVYTELALKRLLAFYNYTAKEHYAPGGQYESWLVVIETKNR